ncbi:MAG: hypothetical protein ABSE16_08470 [Verrucomicrobiota bacterium]
MKTTDSSKSTAIRYESELVHHFRQLIEDETELRWLVPPGQLKQNHLSLVELNLDARTFQFKPVYLLKPSIPELESILKAWTNSSPPLLVVPELVGRILEFCRQKRLAAIDLNGRAYLRAEGLLVDRRALYGRDFRFELEPRNIFVGKSASIVRSLLTDRDRIWVQSELVSRTKASSGLVSRIVQHLISQGFLEKQSPREFRLHDPLGLIDAWVKADDFNRRATLTRYTVFGGSPLEIARQLEAWAREQSVSIAFTQWIAGWLRHPYTEPAVTSAYVARLPETTTLERLGLRPVNDAGKVWLYVPTDEGVFLETQAVQDLSLVTDAQICVDLQSTGLRGPDQAAALRNWEGFCRP